MLLVLADPEAGGCNSNASIDAQVSSIRSSRCESQHGEGYRNLL